ncbi:hypothetical protein B0T14DRAFT_493269 [Immersiella caudata]|uniref:Uncharacterized protein n=1 Tax=Immersiella caudata TaxID=314043 RepID=A0AA40C6K9_9PEZI|nr:hypothetical protein B0T14DRAFT_493269 [Immersiella caudata]
MDDDTSNKGQDKTKDKPVETAKETCIQEEKYSFYGRGGQYRTLLPEKTAYKCAATVQSSKELDLVGDGDTPLSPSNQSYGGLQTLGRATEELDPGHNGINDDMSNGKEDGTQALNIYRLTGTTSPPSRSAPALVDNELSPAPLLDVGDSEDFPDWADCRPSQYPEGPLEVQSPEESGFHTEMRLRGLGLPGDPSAWDIGKPRPPSALDLTSYGQWVACESRADSAALPVRAETLSAPSIPSSIRQHPDNTQVDPQLIDPALAQLDLGHNGNDMSNGGQNGNQRSDNIPGTKAYACDIADTRQGDLARHEKTHTATKSAHLDYGVIAKEAEDWSKIQKRHYDWQTTNLSVR